MHRRAVALVALGSVVVALSLTTGPVSSEAFPGQNGKIAFTQDEPGGETSNIWSANADGSGAVQLTDAGSYEAFAKWSPDGTQIAFTSERNGDQDIFVMDADGTNETQLTFDGATGPAWSPDGTQIAYNRPGTGTGIGPALWVMDADGSNQMQITTVGFAFDRWPSWSPDGTKIAFARQDPETTANEIWVVDPDGSDPVQLTDSGVQTIQSYEPTWSPDGSQLAYTQRNGDSYSIFRMNADGSGQTAITDTGFEIGPAWSPDGTLILFNRFDGPETGLHLMAPDGSDETPIPNLSTGYEGAWQSLAVLPPPLTPTTTPSTTAAPAAQATLATPAFTG